MAQGTLGSFDGVVTPNVDMLTIFKEKELAIHPNSTLAFSPMIIKKIGIQTDAGTVVKINGSDIPIVSGVFELGFGQVDIYSLVFTSSVKASVYYMY